MVPKYKENTETTKSKNMHSGDHFGIAAVSTTDTFLLLKQLCVTYFSAQQRRCRHSQLQESWLTCIYLQSADCAKREWGMTGGSENVSSQHYPVSQSGVIISLLMAKWCSSCQEHRRNNCLVSTMFLHNFNIVTHDKITKDFLTILMWISLCGTMM